MNNNRNNRNNGNNGKVETKDRTIELKLLRAQEKQEIINKINLGDIPIQLGKGRCKIDINQYRTFIKWYKVKHNIIETLRIAYRDITWASEIIETYSNRLEDLMDRADRCYPESYLFDEECSDDERDLQ